MLGQFKKYKCVKYIYVASVIIYTFGYMLLVLNYTFEIEFEIINYEFKNYYSVHI